MKGGTLGNVPSTPPSREAGRAGRSRCLSTREKNTSDHLINRGNLASVLSNRAEFRDRRRGGQSPSLHERACFLNPKRQGVCAEEGRMKAERARFPTEREEERGLNRAALTRWGKASVPSRRILRAPSYHPKKDTFTFPFLLENHNFFRY